jgi:hypothetical protein
MAYPDIPTALRTHLAARAMREHHHLWHLARRSDLASLPLDPWEQAELAKPEWRAPRFQGDDGAGLDFLGMHREMIKQVDGILATAVDANWPRVVGWSPIPFQASDTDWPMPPAWPGMPSFLAAPKSVTSATQQRNAVNQGYRNANALRSVSLDQLGSIIEGNIHNWMHLRWAARPIVDVDGVDPANDYLAAPWSSHVNPVFWKLHGWIDDTIKAWEQANNAIADLSGAWSGPSVHDHGPMAGGPEAVAPRKPTVKSIRWFRTTIKALPGAFGKLDKKPKTKSNANKKAKAAKKKKKA